MRRYNNMGCELCGNKAEKRFCSISCRSKRTNNSLFCKSIVSCIVEGIDIGSPAVKCSKCEDTKSINDFYKHKANTMRWGRQYVCKDCSDSNRESYRRDNEKTFVITMLLSCKSSSKRRRNRGRIESSIFDINYDFIMKMRENQENKCKISGTEMIWKKNSGWKKASIDRIDNNRGYEKDNVQLVCWGVNQAMSDYDITDFLEMCKNVYENNKAT